MHPGVAPVQQAFQLIASPEQLAVEAASERPGDAPDLPEWNVLEPPGLDGEHDLPRHAGERRQVALPKALSDPEPTDGRSEPLVIHPRRMPSAAYAPITRQSPGSRGL